MLVQRLGSVGYNPNISNLLISIGYNPFPNLLLQVWFLDSSTWISKAIVGPEPGKTYSKNSERLWTRYNFWRVYRYPKGSRIVFRNPSMFFLRGWTVTVNVGGCKISNQACGTWFRDFLAGKKRANQKLFIPKPMEIVSNIRHLFWWLQALCGMCGCSCCVARLVVGSINLHCLLVFGDKLINLIP